MLPSSRNRVRHGGIVEIPPRSARPSLGKARFFGVDLDISCCHGARSRGSDLDIRNKSADAVAAKEIKVDAEELRLANGRRRGACTGQEIPELIHRMGCDRLQRAEVLRACHARIIGLKSS